ncbi:hypothetical protein BJF78_12065 [Pseudonocardia sp. CNS-139]|nr:hypothetical protein BJF78_12065 [Pseudonocardia sp. CNS-139]
MLAGLPVAPTAGRPDGGWAASGWAGEVEARTACPTHQALLDTDERLRRGALAEQVPAAWHRRADPARIGVPVLGLHGAADTVTPLDAARGWYARVPDAELVSIAGGRHDALNDQTHRTAAATVVLFLERLRAGVPEIAHRELLVPYRAGGDNRTTDEVTR